MTRSLLLLLISIAYSLQALAQTPLLTWRDHLPYRKTVAVTEGDGKVYVAAENAVFVYFKKDNLAERLSKVNGLSDVGISNIAYNNGIVFITYKNGNIDVLENKRITNYSDIKRSNIIGNKSINGACFNGNYCYLACGFGIVVFDLTRKEIKETYFIGGGGSYVNVYDIEVLNNTLYAASDSGIYYASLSNPNLIDYNQWSKFNTIPNGTYNQIHAFNGNLIANLSLKLTSGQNNKDTLYLFNGSNWNYFPPDTTGITVKSISSNSQKLLITANSQVDFFDTNLVFLDRFSPFNSGYYIEPNMAIIDAANDSWVADTYNGLIKVYCSVWCNNKIIPEGPNTKNVYRMDIVNNELWVAPGTKNDLWIGNYNFDGIFYYKNDKWGVYNFDNTPALAPVRDIVCVAINPKNSSQVFAGSLEAGLLEFNNGALTTIYDENNSSLQVRGDAPTSGWVGVFGAKYDSNGNLWVTNSLANDVLSVRKSNGTWQSFNFNGLASYPTVGEIIITSNNQKWMILPRGGGLIAFNENGTWSTADDDARKLIATAGQGGLPSNEVYSIAEDLDGEIWVGTDKGLAVFFSPENIFSSNAQDAQPILIDQDGHIQILLETEVVTAIAVDGANRKWIGTQNSGVYLLSPDGTKEIFHFTESNSPLFSNSITNIAINHESGEVFIGTINGIISFKSTATEGLEDFTNVYAYPNPVRSGYNGLIAIKGLVKDCDVKITDISGVLVYQTKALGGQAIWDGKNFNGDRVNSGMYLVFLSNEDGSKTYVTKICVVN